MKFGMRCCCTGPATKAWYARKAWATPLTDSDGIPWQEVPIPGGVLGSPGSDYEIDLRANNSTPGEVQLTQGMRFEPFAPEQDGRWHGGKIQASNNPVGYPIGMTNARLFDKNPSDNWASYGYPFQSGWDTTGPGCSPPIVSTHPFGSLTRSHVYQLRTPLATQGSIRARLKYWRLVINGSPGPLHTMEYQRYDEEGNEVYDPHYGMDDVWTSWVRTSVQHHKQIFDPGNTYGIDIWLEVTRYTNVAALCHVRSNTLFDKNIGCGTLGFQVGCNSGFVHTRHGYKLTYSGEAQFPLQKEVTLEPTDTDSSLDYSEKTFNPSGRSYSGETHTLKWAHEIPRLTVVSNTAPDSQQYPDHLHYIPPNNAGHPTRWWTDGIPASAPNGPTQFWTSILNPGGQWDCKSPINFVPFAAPTANHYYPPDVRSPPTGWDSSVRIARYSLVSEDE